VLNRKFNRLCHSDIAKQAILLEGGFALICWPRPGRRHSETCRTPSACRRSITSRNRNGIAPLGASWRLRQVSNAHALLLCFGLHARKPSMRPVVCELATNNRRRIQHRQITALLQLRQNRPPASFVDCQTIWQDVKTDAATHLALFFCNERMTESVQPRLPCQPLFIPNDSYGAVASG